MEPDVRGVTGIVFDHRELGEKGLYYNLDTVVSSSVMLKNKLKYIDNLYRPVPVLLYLQKNIIISFFNLKQFFLYHMNDIVSDLIQNNKKVTRPPVTVLEIQ